MTKVCNGCKVEKLLTEFSFRLSGKGVGKPRSRCKACECQWAKINYTANPNKHREYSRQYRLANLEKVAAYMKPYRKKDYAKNRARYIEEARQWRLLNPGKRSIADRKRDAERRASDPDYKTKYAVRSLVRFSLNRSKLRKSKRTTEYIGCPIADFRAHIEKHFWQGMSWQNQGQWHLDHIKPCASFDLSDPAQQAACFHWSNWQPLWADDNMAKSDRLDWSPAESKHSLPARLALKPWDCEGLGKSTLRL